MSRIVDGEIAISADRLAQLQLTEMRYNELRARYVAADFADPQFPDAVVIKFALPFRELRVSSDLDATVDRAMTLAADEVTP